MLSYHTPDTKEEALALRAEHGTASMVVGGGTIVMRMMNEGVPLPEVAISLKRTGLDLGWSDKGSRVIGAMTTMTTLAGDESPLLRRAAAGCGGWAIKNMATIGGNVFAPAPAGDIGVALLALDALVRLETVDTTRVVPAGEFFGTGRAVGEDEILTGFEIPSSKSETRYVKYGRKAGVTPSVVTVAIGLIRDNGRISDARIALGSMGPDPVRAHRAESMLVGNELTRALIDRTAAVSTEDFPGLTDGIASAWYRKRMARLHVTRLLDDFLQHDEVGHG